MYLEPTNPLTAINSSHLPLSILPYLLTPFTTLTTSYPTTSPLPFITSTLNVTPIVDKAGLSALGCWALFFTGSAHITLPNGTEEAWVESGRNGPLIAADTACGYGCSSACVSESRADVDVADSVPRRGCAVA
ncbi:hypothetical protein EMCG_07390 [[Emmonsia] crescens]|uniref:Uncharacterized protein n=1 Tax=[Emmonsia] crescens TaxID=73230 RepID=A0A0G2J5N9_9EURO|nr:hypothetical protein EMCG_07390 [Emmonsia crescens UAMH 3008]